MYSAFIHIHSKSLLLQRADSGFLGCLCREYNYSLLSQNILHHAQYNASIEPKSKSATVEGGEISAEHVMFNTCTNTLTILCASQPVVQYREP
jgi:hypothetical protein